MMRVLRGDIKLCLLALCGHPYCECGKGMGRLYNRQNFVAISSIMMKGSNCAAGYF